MKVPHLRNMYQKVGMFGMDTTFNPTNSAAFSFLPAPYNSDSFTGDQVRGFGFLHDGSTDTVFRFHASTAFVQRPLTNPFPNPGGIPVITDPTDPVKAAQQLSANITLRRQIEAFVLAFDSNLAPIVGQQVTLSFASGDDAGDRLALLEARAVAGECELVAHGAVFGDSFGLLFVPQTGRFTQDKGFRPSLSDSDVRLLARLGTLTFTAVPPGSGRRMGIDRDLDGVLDGNEFF